MVSRVWSGSRGKKATAHLQRAEMPVGKAHLESCEFVAEEADVKDGVMGHQDTVGDEGVKARENLLRRRLTFEHLVGDAMDRLYYGRDRDSSIDERRELLHNGAVFDCDRADLDDPMAVTR